MSVLVRQMRLCFLLLVGTCDAEKDLPGCHFFFVEVFNEGCRPCRSYAFRCSTRTGTFWGHMAMLRTLFRSVYILALVCSLFLSVVCLPTNVSLTWLNETIVRSLTSTASTVTASIHHAIMASENGSHSLPYTIRSTTARPLTDSAVMSYTYTQTREPHTSHATKATTGRIAEQTKTAFNTVTINRTSQALTFTSVSSPKTGKAGKSRSASCTPSFTLPILIEKPTSDLFPGTGRLKHIVKIALKDAQEYSELAASSQALLIPKYITLDLKNRTAVDEVSRFLLQLIECPTPVLSLLIPKEPGFLQIATILGFFQIPLLSPFPMPQLADHISNPNIVAFSAPQAAQAIALLDFAEFVGWSRLAMIYSLQSESAAMSQAIESEGLSRGINVHALKPLPVFPESRFHSFRQAISPLSASWKADIVTEMSNEISNTYTTLDYTVFIICVDPESLGSVLAAMKESGIQGLPGIAFLATDSIIQVFRSSTALLYGVSDEDDGESPWWLTERLLGTNADQSALQGWIFLSQSYALEWDRANAVLSQKLLSDMASSKSARASNSTVASFDNGDSGRRTASDKHFYATKHPCGTYELLVYDLVRSTWKVIRQEYNLIGVTNCSNTKTDTTDLSPLPLCINSKTMPVSLDKIDLLHRFKADSKTRKSKVFVGLLGSTLLDQFGAAQPKFTFFNLRWVTPFIGTRKIIPVPIARWTASGLSSPSLSPLSSWLSIQAGHLISSLTRLGVGISLGASSTESTQSLGLSNITSSDWVEQISVNDPDLGFVQFPGGLQRIPRDCLFCRKGATAPPTVWCLMCEEDRQEIEVFSDHLKRYNPTKFVGIGSISLNASQDPDATSVCELWPGVLRCNSPWSYILDLEGLELEGPLPENIGRLRHAQELKFYRNFFSGHIPPLSPNLCPDPKSGRAWKRSEVWPALGQERSKLKALYLGKNQLEGPISNDIGNCDQLEILSIKMNRFRDGLPLSMCRLTSLIELDISGNQISGSLPDCIGGIYSESTLWDTTGDEPAGLFNLQYLNGDSNKLIGSFPAGFRRLTRLILISLKSNNLNGVIPDIWTSFSSNLLIDISQNPQLAPPMPRSLTSRLLEDPTKIVVDPHLFGCSKGHRAPTPEDWTDAWLPMWSRNDSANLEIFCKPCPIGSVPTPDSRTCKKCPRGSIAPHRGSFTCSKCQAGTFSDENGHLCNPCPPGTYGYIVGSFICHPCPADHFSEDFGSVVCLPVSHEEIIANLVPWQCPKGANCTTVEQQRKPQAAIGWFRIEKKNSSSEVPGRRKQSEILTSSSTFKFKDSFLIDDDDMFGDDMFSWRSGHTEEGQKIDGESSLDVSNFYWLEYDNDFKSIESNNKHSPKNRSSLDQKGNRRPRSIEFNNHNHHHRVELLERIPKDFYELTWSPRRLQLANVTTTAAAKNDSFVTLAETLFDDGEGTEDSFHRSSRHSAHRSSPTLIRDPNGRIVSYKQPSLYPDEYLFFENEQLSNEQLYRENSLTDFKLLSDSESPLPLDIKHPSFKKRVSERQFNVYECPIASHCLGNNICAANSYGPYCHRCVPNYALPMWSTECKKCKPLWLSLLRLGIIGSILFLVGYVLFKSIRHAGRESWKRRSCDGLHDERQQTKLFPLVVSQSHSRQTQAVILKVFTNWIELTAQALVMAVQVALMNDGQKSVEISDRLEGLYNFIQNLDDPFSLFLPFDCISPHWFPLPIHTGLLLAFLAPILILLIPFVWKVWNRWTYFKCNTTTTLNPLTQDDKLSPKTNTRAQCSFNRNGTEKEIDQPEHADIITTQASEDTHASHFSYDESDNKENVLSQSSTKKANCCQDHYKNSYENPSVSIGSLESQCCPIRSDTVDVPKDQNLETKKTRFNLNTLKIICWQAWPSTVGIFIPIFFLIHPAITRQFLNNLQCDSLDELRLSRDAGLLCTSGTHSQFMYLAWCGLLIWTFGMPLMFGLIMKSYRNELYEENVLLQFKFLLDGYEHRYYWWEVWAMLRKVLVDVPPVVPFLDDDLQLVALLIVAAVSLAAHVAAEPFDNRCFKIADRLESLVLWSFLLTLLTIPVHQTLVNSNTKLTSFLSKCLLTITIGASAIFVGWAGVFYARPMIKKLDDWDKAERKAKCFRREDSSVRNGDRVVVDPYAHTYSTDLKKINDNTIRSFRLGPSPETSKNSRKSDWCVSIDSLLKSDSGCAALQLSDHSKNKNVSRRSTLTLQHHQAGCLDARRSSMPLDQMCDLKSSEQLFDNISTLEAVSMNQEDTLKSSSRPSEAATKESSSQSNHCLLSIVNSCLLFGSHSWTYWHHNFLTPCVRQLGFVCRNILLSNISRRILHLEPRRVWIDANGIMNMSDLRRRDRRFLRQLILEDLLDALFHPKLSTLDTRLMTSTLLSIFRRRAFQLEVKQTREGLKRIMGQRTGTRWSNPFFLMSRRKLQPILSAVRSLKDTGLQRLQSVGGALTINRTPYGLKSETTFEPTQDMLNKTTQTSAETQFNKKRVFDRTTSMMSSIPYHHTTKRRMTCPKINFQSDCRVIPQRLETLNAKFRENSMVSSFNSSACNHTNLVVEALPETQQTTWSSSSPPILPSCPYEPPKKRDPTTSINENNSSSIFFSTAGLSLGSSQYSSSDESTGFGTSLSQKFGSSCNSQTLRTFSQNELEQFAPLPIERLRRVVLMVRCAFTLYRCLREFPQALLPAATQIGLTVEELQAEVARLNFRRLSPILPPKISDIS